MPWGYALAGAVRAEVAGILIDEQFGAVILCGAKQDEITTACCAEKSGQEEFNIDGADVGQHIDSFGRSFCKVLARSSPEGGRDLNCRLAARLMTPSIGVLHRGL